MFLAPVFIVSYYCLVTYCLVTILESQIRTTWDIEEWERRERYIPPQRKVNGMKIDGEVGVCKYKGSYYDEDHLHVCEGLIFPYKFVKKRGGYTYYAMVYCCNYHHKKQAKSVSDTWDMVLYDRRVCCSLILCKKCLGKAREEISF